MKHIGLTGGIASGKSTVAAILREMGFPGALRRSRLSQTYGPWPSRPRRNYPRIWSDIADANEQIDRARLAAIVFADTVKLARLNSFLHPRVEKIMLQQFDDWERNGIHDAAFVEAALLIEAGFDKKLDGLVIAWCEPAQQLERLRARGMSEIEAKRRIAAQLPVAEKLKHATYIIDCSRSIAETLTASSNSGR